MQERFEDSPFYQMIRERSHEEGREEGRNEEARELLLTLIQSRYAQSDLIHFAEKMVRDINDRAVIHRLVREVAQKATPEDVHALLLATIEGTNLEH